MKSLLVGLTAACAVGCYLPTPAPRPPADHCSLPESWTAGRIEYAADIADSGQGIKPRSKATFELRSTIPFGVAAGMASDSVRDSVSGCIFAAQPEHNQLDVVDPISGKTVGTFAISGGDRPSVLAIDADARLLFVANAASPSVLVVDLDKARVMSVLQTKALIVRLAVDPGWHRLYGQTTDGRIGAYDLRRSRLFLTAEPNQSGSIGIGVDARTHDVYVTAIVGSRPALLVLRPLPPAPVRCVFHHSNSDCWARFAITR